MDSYGQLVADIFRRFPSVQKEGFKPGAYKPGLEGMRAFDQVLGYPSRQFKSIHIAGTNGKGSVANMLASALTVAGYKTGLYTSPHLVDFRERARICGEMIPQDYVEAFLRRWKPYFEAENLSFFEITTGMAFRWFADEKVDVAVIEAGLGGRLDSTNLLVPELSIITSIGLDHCALLGDTLEAIAAEKAGIMKPGVPCVIGESNPATNPVFDAAWAAVSSKMADFKDTDVNLGLASLNKANFKDEEAEKGLASLNKADFKDGEAKPGLVYADRVEPWLWERHEEILKAMDLQAPVQRKNLRTVLTALEVLSIDSFGRLRLPQNDRGGYSPQNDRSNCHSERSERILNEEKIVYGIEHTASLMHFHGRWERLQERPLVICDIGHNAHALASNFKALEAMNRPLIIVYGIMADKDLDAIIPLMPRKAQYIFVAPDTPRAMKAEEVLRRVTAEIPGTSPRMTEAPSVKDGMKMALDMAAPDTVVYVGGSTFVVAEVLSGKTA